ncbi:MAG: NAD(P)H-dependent glycerol-3-phosphate dehydrogenase [Cytophagaceae bacterium]|nr:NAD(P)H-dependent glycerol-3-phosphate dehydrogenase [Cytophagaceae bacterium]
MQKKNEATKIAVIGGGSWATALIKILSENNVRINWWLKDKEDVLHIRDFGKNPHYLSEVVINTKKVRPTANLKKAVEDVQVVIFVVPAAFIGDVLEQFSVEDLKDKIIVSAIKGMIPSENALVTDILHKQLGVETSKTAVIAGPCHAEEVAMEKRSYLTIAGESLENAQLVAELLHCRFVKTSIVQDLYGVEYSAVMKNIIAIACGIARGLNYGDNFQAVMVSNAMQEIHRFVDAMSPLERDWNASAYLGDLLVTCYSPYSRNRTLGNMVGRGYSVKSAQVEMNMIAEGYYAVKCIHEINARLKVPMPITKAVYNILYEKISPSVELRILEDSMN